jgi:hypothetical protein
MRDDEQKLDRRHRAADEAPYFAEISFPQNRLYVDPAFAHRKHVRLFLEIPVSAGKSAEVIVFRVSEGRAKHKEKIHK